MPEQEIDLSKDKAVHLVGIGGAGMGAIAEVLATMGHQVSGSDIKDSHRLDRLKTFGVETYIGHDSENIGDVDFVAHSTAISASNVEILETHKKGIPLLSRERVLSAISTLKDSLAVAGTHGKTTTASMLSLVLRDAGLHPSFIIGGEVNEIGTGALWDTGEILVIEADESDASFLGLKRQFSIITNLEADHLEFFGGFEALYEAFVKFGKETNGPVVLGIDDESSLRLSKDIEAITVGFHKDAEWKIEVSKESWNGSDFTVFSEGSSEINLSIPLPGLHNVKNASLTAVAGILLGVGAESVRSSLTAFAGVARRFEHRGKENGVTFVDDYAHLPSEVESTIGAASNGSWNRLVAVFQPHRYSRTQSIGHTFAHSFNHADLVVITDIFPGGEEVRPGVSGRIVFDAIVEKSPGMNVQYFPNRAQLVDFLVNELVEGDICLTLGAGDITSLSEEIKFSMRDLDGE